MTSEVNPGITFWISSGLSVETLRICWASCRLIPVMLDTAADCCPGRPLARAAAWLAGRGKYTTEIHPEVTRRQHGLCRRMRLADRLLFCRNTKASNTWIKLHSFPSCEETHVSFNFATAINKQWYENTIQVQLLYIIIRVLLGCYATFYPTWLSTFFWRKKW